MPVKLGCVDGEDVGWAALAWRHVFETVAIARRAEGATSYSLIYYGPMVLGRC
jgi:hypothetical protein